MIGMLIFSISACSENTGSDVSSQITSNTNDFSSVEDTVSDVSSDVTSSRPTINYEGTSVTPPDPDKIAEASSRNNESEISSQPNKSGTADFHVPDLGDSHIRLYLSPDGAAKMGEITVESLSNFYEIEVDEIQEININKADPKKSVQIYFTIIDGDDFYKIEEATEKIYKNKYTVAVDSKACVYAN